MERNINIIVDLDGGKIVVINDITFNGRFGGTPIGHLLRSAALGR